MLSLIQTHVSISALSDHFGHHIDNGPPLTERDCFNIRSIGSLWSSSLAAAQRFAGRRFNIRSIGSLWSSQRHLAHGDQHQRFNIRSIGSLWSSRVFVADEVRVDRVSISALSDHFGHHKWANSSTPANNCFNIRSIGSLWSSFLGSAFAERHVPFQYPLYRITLVILSLCRLPRSTPMFQYPLYRITLVILGKGFVAKHHRVVSISALSDHFGHQDKSMLVLTPCTLFQYPLYRITLVIATIGDKLAMSEEVSISALSDHFGHLLISFSSSATGFCFNIRSIGSLWSSNKPATALALTIGFQYPLYRITLVIVWTDHSGRGVYNVSISALSDHFGHRRRRVFSMLPVLFQYPLYRITLVIITTHSATAIENAVSISALSDHFGHQSSWLM